MRPSILAEGKMYKVSITMVTLERSRKTRDIEPLLVQCWASVVDGEPTLNQQWLNVSCLLGCFVLIDVRLYIR